MNQFNISSKKSGDYSILDEGMNLSRIISLLFYIE